MQAVISVPELAGRLSEQHATEMLMRPIAGVPLLLRTVLTAARAGANQILLICPVALSDGILQRFTTELTLHGVEVITLYVREFNPRVWSVWVILRPYLEKQFVWLPWN